MTSMCQWLFAVSRAHGFVMNRFGPGPGPHGCVNVQLTICQHCQHVIWLSSLIILTDQRSEIVCNNFLMTTHERPMKMLVTSSVFWQLRTLAWGIMDALNVN